ncbi:MAG TPA: hypothetical protein VK589_21330 [Chryseolinea sp.]|nr:hypothetical protein [Chryseolinea sp.]
MKGSGKISTLAKPSTARTVMCLLLILFSQLQSAAAYSNTSVKPTKKKNSKEYTIKSSMLLPSSTKVEVINQELPWSEELLFKTELNEKLVVDFSCIIKGFFPDLFRVIAPSNAP